MYLGDPRENQICPDEHTIWEDDNRVEKRYQWNAMVVDYCDLDPKEYAQTIFHVSGDTSGGEGLTTNEMTINITDNDATVIMDYSPTSELFISVIDYDGGNMIIKIEDGSPTTIVEPLSGVVGYKVIDSFIGLSKETATSKSCKDGTYRYVIHNGSTPEPPKESECRYGYFKHIDTITEESILENTSKINVKNNECEFEYNIKPVSITGFNDMDEEEYNEVIRQQELDLYVFTTDEINEIFINDSEEQTSSWERNYTIFNIEGVNYYATRFVQHGLANIYDPNYEEQQQMIFDYKITTE